MWEAARKEGSKALKRKIIKKKKIKKEGKEKTNPRKTERGWGRYILEERL